MSNERLTLEEEVRVLDMLPSAQRKIYLESVRQVRGKDVEQQLREGLVKLWQSFR